MTVDVRITAQARHDVLAILTARMPTTVDAQVTAVFYSEEAARVLRRHAAPPPGAIVQPRRGGGWWLFAGGLWLALEVTDRPRRLFRGPRRTFTIVAAAARPPAA